MPKASLWEKKIFASNSQNGFLEVPLNSRIITRSDLIARAKASEKAIEQGDITSIEVFEEESKTWL